MLMGILLLLVILIGLSRLGVIVFLGCRRSLCRGMGGFVIRRFVGMLRVWRLLVVERKVREITTYENSAKQIEILYLNNVLRPNSRSPCYHITKF
jgi:hypothetical protein